MKMSGASRRHTRLVSAKVLMWSFALVTAVGIFIPGGGLVVAVIIGHKVLRRDPAWWRTLVGLGLVLLIGDIGILSCPVSPSIPPHGGGAHIAP